MADEQDEKPNFDEVRVIMDLERIGELIAAVATRFAQIRGIDPPDYDGAEMRDLAVSGWRHIEYMDDRARFAESVTSDLEALTSAPAEPQHRSEFDL